MAKALKDLERVAADIGHMIGSLIDPQCGSKEVGFAFLLFDFGLGGHMTYISNADRKDMIVALTEMLEKLKAAPDKPPVRRAGEGV